MTHIACSQSLSENHDIWRHASLLGCKQRPGPSKTCRDLVENQKDAVLRTQSSYLLKIQRTVHIKTTGALHQWLNNDCCYSV